MKFLTVWCPAIPLTILFAGRGRDIVLNCHSSCLTILYEECCWKNNKKLANICQKFKFQTRLQGSSYKFIIVMQFSIDGRKSLKVYVITHSAC
jgi:hypothetical protein